MPLMNQLQPKWEALASLYSVREKPSKIYGWSTFVLSNIVVEIPYNFVTGSLFFIGWYFGVGFSQPFSGSESNNRGIYQWLMIMLFEMWWSTFGQAMAALASSAEVASTFTTLFASFVITFNGVLQPLSALVQFWHWMYYLSPFTYLIGGLVANSISGTTVVCAPSELNIFNPPSGQTCQSFAGAFVEVSGKLLNPEATSNCEYCRYSVGDQYLHTLNMSLDDRWRNFGFMWVYILFNAFCVFLFFYLTKVARFNTMELAAKFSKKTAKTESESSSMTETEKVQNSGRTNKEIPTV
jgi:ABC-type multidrug transport system permease subunit